MSANKALTKSESDSDLHELESSDSIETLETFPEKDSHIEICENTIQQLSLTNNESDDILDCAGGNVVDKHRHQSYNSTDSVDSHEVIPEPSSVISRPESLSLPQSLQAETTRSRSQSENNANACNVEELRTENPSVESLQAVPHKLASENVDRNDPVSSDAPDPASQAGLPQGTITRQGGMIQFVAADLTEKIRLSSPPSQGDSDSLCSRRSSLRSVVSASSSTSAATSMTSSGKSRSPSSSGWQPSPDIPAIDVAAVAELESRAVAVAGSLELMMGNIRNNLHKQSAITIGCQEAYKRSVDITCDSVDGSIKSMYAMMAKCEELSTSMKPVEQLASQIKEIKRILELFETQVNDIK